MVHRRWTILSAAIVVLVAAACSDEHAIPGAPGAAIREGARVSAQGTARLRVIASGQETTVPWASSATVRRGIALAARREAPASLSEAAAGFLPQMAVADGAPSAIPAGVQTFTFTDSTKHHTYRLVATPGPATGAPARLEAYLDGQKVMQSDFTWTRDVGGWRAHSAHITGYYHGAVLAEGDVSATTAEIAGASLDLMRPLAHLGAVLLPTELRAAQATICTAEWLMWGLAEGAYGTASIALYLDPVNPGNWAAYWTAAAGVEVAEYFLYQCYARGGR